MQLRLTRTTCRGDPLRMATTRRVNLPNEGPPVTNICGTELNRDVPVKFDLRAKNTLQLSPPNLLTVTLPVLLQG